MASVSVRSYLAAGVAAVGVGAVALAPVHPLSAHLAVTPTQAAALAVDLAAAVDPITALIDTIEATGSNLSALVNNWASGIYVEGTFPFPPNLGNQPGGTGFSGNGNLGWRTGGYTTGGPLPILQQVLQNGLTYLGELPDIGGILGQVFDNIGNAFGAPFAAGVNETGRLSGLAVALGTLDNFNQNVNATPYIPLSTLGTFSQRDIGALLPTIFGPSYAALEPIIDFTTTPISGLLVGAIGPIVGPVLSVINSVSAAFDYLSDSDFESAFYELINRPTNAIGAFLNGGPTLDLTGLVGALGLELPATITSLGLKMGGLLSPGGVAFDSVAAVASTDLGLLPAPITVNVPGLPVGPIGALLGLTNYVATAITPTDIGTTAAVRAAAAEAEAPAGAAPQPQATDPEAQAPTALSADRSAADAPAPVKQRQSRKAAADTGGASASAGTDSAPKASAARRASR